MSVNLKSQLAYSFAFLGVFSALSAGADPIPKRVHLLKFVSEGYEPFKNKISSLDVAVLEKKEAEKVTCEILAPRAGTRVAKTAWAPADLYANLQNEKEQKAAGDRLGEKDIFFVGDDKNRNGKNDAHDWTVFPDPSLTNSMDFLDKKVSPHEFSYFFRFTRKGIFYQSIIRVTAKASSDGCSAVAYICDAKSLNAEARTCADGGWRNFRKAIVSVDVRGGLTDQLKPPASDRERNDVAALKVVLSDVDADGNPKGDPYEETVAKK